MLKITGLAHRKSYVVIICANSVYHKIHFVKLKLVQTLLRSLVLPIGSHMLLLLVPVHVKSLAKLKFIQILLKITSIVQNLTYEGHPRSMVIQFKDHTVN